MCDARHPAVHAHERAEFQTQWARFQDSLRAGRNHWCFLFTAVFNVAYFTAIGKLGMAVINSSTSVIVALSYFIFKNLPEEKSSPCA